MNNLIVTLVFGILTAIFLIGIVMVITNAVKIARFNNLSLKRLKEENCIKLVYIKTEIQNKLIPLIPSLPVLTSSTLNQKLLAAFIPITIGSKTAS